MKINNPALIPTLNKEGNQKAHGVFSRLNRKLPLNSFSNKRNTPKTSKYFSLHIGRNDDRFFGNNDVKHQRPRNIFKSEFKTRETVCCESAGKHSTMAHRYKSKVVMSVSNNPNPAYSVFEVIQPIPFGTKQLPDGDIRCRF